MFNNTVRLTDYKTIKGNGFKEIEVNKFIKLLEKNIDKGGFLKDMIILNLCLVL